jgi:hypothetical protein
MKPAESRSQTPIAGNPRISANFPITFVTRRNLTQVVSWGSDITRIEIDSGGDSWSPAQDFETPENTSGIIDVAPAVSAIFGQGLFVLYKTQGVSALYAQFRKRSVNGRMKTFTTSVKCPTG